MTFDTDDPDWVETVNEAFPNDNDYPVDRDDYAGPVVRVRIAAGWQGIARMRDFDWIVHDVEAVNSGGQIDILFRKA